jgi:hypothetical protein
MIVGWKTRLTALATTSATSTGATSEMRLRNDTEQPVQALPMSQMIEGAAGLAKASFSSRSLAASRPSAAADRPQ